MIKVIKNYSEIPDIQNLMEILHDQMSFIGASSENEHLKSALRNAMKPESRVRIFLSLSETEELQGFAFTNICSGLESGADYLWINELHISDKFRKKGLAEELLDFIERWALNQDMPYMACITSSENNSALSLYKKRGFEISKTLWVDKSLELQNSDKEAPSLKIRTLGSDENPPMSLFLNADPSEKLVKEYLSRGICLIAELQDKTVGALILMPTEEKIIEIMNISVQDNLQNRGIGKTLISTAIAEAKSQGAKSLEIGTGNNGFGQLYLYQKCGFRISGVDQDFFRRNYSEKIYENGLECRDMVRLTMELK